MGEDGSASHARYEVVPNGATSFVLLEKQGHMWYHKSMYTGRNQLITTKFTGAPSAVGRRYMYE